MFDLNRLLIQTPFEMIDATSEIRDRLEVVSKLLKGIEDILCKLKFERQLPQNESYICFCRQQPTTNVSEPQFDRPTDEIDRKHGVERRPCIDGFERRLKFDESKALFLDIDDNDDDDDGSCSFRKNSKTYYETNNVNVRKSMRYKHRSDTKRVDHMRLDRSHDRLKRNLKIIKQKFMKCFDEINKD